MAKLRAIEYIFNIIHAPNDLLYDLLDLWLQSIIR